MTDDRVFETTARGYYLSEGQSHILKVSGTRMMTKYLLYQLTGMLWKRLNMEPMGRLKTDRMPLNIDEFLVRMSKQNTRGDYEN